MLHQLFHLGQKSYCAKLFLQCKAPQGGEGGQQNTSLSFLSSFLWGLCLNVLFLSLLYSILCTSFVKLSRIAHEESENSLAKNSFSGTKVSCFSLSLSSRSSPVQTDTALQTCRAKEQSVKSHLPKGHGNAKIPSPRSPIPGEIFFFIISSSSFCSSSPPIPDSP